MTNYSGHTQFCDDANSFLVESDGMESAHDAVGGRWFKGQGNWCTFSVDSLIEAMRAAHDAKQSGNADVLNAKHQECLKTAQEFTWANTIKKIETVL